MVSTDHGAGFGVQRLAAAFVQASLLAVRWRVVPRRASSPGKIGSKLPHSKALRAGNIFRAKSNKIRSTLCVELGTLVGLAIDGTTAGTG